MTEKRFIEQFEENVQKYPDKVVLRDEHSSLTFRELDELSGRVYAYLKEKGIGLEDVVMLLMPRSKEYVAAMLGVWKAGACLVMEEQVSPKERLDYIRNESECKLVIDETVWERVLEHQPLLGHVETNVHDACLILYTSGSEGRPKGVLHEYGKLELCASTYKCNGEMIFAADDVFASSLPFFSVSAFILTVSPLYVGAQVVIFPLATMRDANMYQQYINRFEVNVVAFPTSYLSVIKSLPTRIHTILVGTEAASHVALIDGVRIINNYSQTEAAFGLATMLIDKDYDNTPVGKIHAPIEHTIVDGELCYENPYTRGYIKDESMTRYAFREGVFHTNDFVRINEDGNYVVEGRITDTIKINGNRIEPAEIEAAVKKVLGIDWAFAKGFVEPERSFVVVYYTANINIDYASVREQLLKVLPTYMIPSYFVQLDDVPHLPNGKVDRQALKAPEIDNYRAEHVAPENELEDRLCTEMKNVLCLDQLGANDDFYLLGGDSLKTIELVSNLAIEGLSVTDIYAARTPRAIAERWMIKMIE